MWMAHICNAAVSAQELPRSQRCSCRCSVAEHGKALLAVTLTLPCLHGQELLEAEKENQQDIVDVIDEERSKVKATTQITETVYPALSLHPSP